MQRNSAARTLLVVIGITLVTAPGCSPGPRVILYCAQDREFAEGLLGDFTKQTSLPVVPKFDTEATKSVSLYREIVAEQNRPRCDVFWNNEILSTIRLQEQGLLEPYASPSARPFPEWAKAKDHTWHAFAARARILIVNTRLLEEAQRPRSLLELTDPRWKGKVVMAKPLFGTTATQAACLFEVLGPNEAKAFYKGLKANEIHIAPGNRQVAEWVGKGRTPDGKPVAVGMTDTDDALAEVEAGRDVTIVYPDRAGGPVPRLGTLYIPNTVMILKGSPNPEGARRLVDFLLSPEAEKHLAEGPGAQIPLDPEVEANLPSAIEPPRKVRAMEVNWPRAAALWEQSQEFLTTEFTAP